jgi:hypothetical protein
MDVMRDAERVCEALRELGGSSTRAGLWEALPDVPSAIADRREILAYAARQGWLELSPKKLSLTAKGNARFGPQFLSRESAAAAMAEPGYEPPRELYKSVLARLPEPHARFADVVISEIIARYHLADIRVNEWPGNMAIGGSGSGKTTIHKLITRLFGIDHVAHTVDMTQSQTLGALRGLHVPQRGFQPSHYMSYPYIAFEEMDKSDDKIKVVDAYFRGEIRQETRGTRYRVLPVPVIYANPPRKNGEIVTEGEDKYSLLHPAWRRRSFVLDTDYISPDEKSDVEDFAAWLDDDNLEPEILHRESFKVDSRLSDAGKDILRSVRELLTTDYRNRNLWSGFGPLELVALGQAALHGINHVTAAWRTGEAYLIIAETIPGQVIPGAREIWRAVARNAGKDAAGLREIIRAEIKAREAQIPRLPAVVPPTPEETAMERLKFLSNRDKMLTNLQNGLKIFNPELYPANTYERSVSEQYSSEFRAFITAIGNTRDATELAPYVTLYSRMLEQAKPQAEILKRWHEQERANQVRSEFQEAMAELERDPGHVLTYTPQNPTQYAEMLAIVRSTSRRYGFEFEETDQGTIEIWKPEEEEPEENTGEPDRLAIEGPYRPHSLNRDYYRAPETSIAGLIANGIAASRVRAEKYGRCQYPENHRLLVKVAGWEPPSATVRITGSLYEYAGALEYGMPVIHTCGNDKCINRAIMDLPTPYHRREDLW